MCHFTDDSFDVHLMCITEKDTISAKRADA